MNNLGLFVWTFDTVVSAVMLGIMILCGLGIAGAYFWYYIKHKIHNRKK